MTQFELESLSIAKYQLWTSIATDGIAVLALVAAAVGGWAAHRTVKIIVQQLEMSRWDTLLSFEQDMAVRRSKFAEIAAELRAHPDAPSGLLRSTFQEAKESYFNALDRLASSILNAHFPDSEMKQDYEEVLMTVVRGFPEDFATGTRFRKVVKLYNKWQDQG